MPGFLENMDQAFSTIQSQEALVTWLALFLGAALGLGLMGSGFAFYFLWRHRNPRRQRIPRRIHWSRRRRWPLMSRAKSYQWLAIQNAHPHLVQATLHLHNPVPCNWEEGLNATDEQKLFISPLVNGWTLVMGASLPDPSQDVDACFHFIRHLSEQLGQVQFFSFDRARRHHAWVQATDGQVRRAYAWAGKTVWNQGEPTQAERELNLTCYDYLEYPDPAFLGRTDPLQANTINVPSLANRWSVNPAAIDFRWVRQSQGISGHMSCIPLC